jgi:hypothetical protein
MTQPQARVVKPRSRTRLIPPSSRTVGPNPRIENVADPRDARTTDEQTSYRRCAHLRSCLHMFYQCDSRVDGERLEPTRRSLPTIGFDLRRIGVWEGDIARGRRARPSDRSRDPLPRVTRIRSITHFGWKGSLSRRRILFGDSGCRRGRTLDEDRRQAAEMLLSARQHADRHLQRTRDSAEYFGFLRPAGDIHDARRAVASYDVPLRVRLMLGRGNGGAGVEPGSNQRDDGDDRRRRSATRSRLRTQNGGR